MTDNDQQREVVSKDYSQTGDVKIRKPSTLIQQRYVLTLMAFFGFVMVYSMRVNLNVAMVEMVKHSESTKISTSCVAAARVSTNTSSTWSHKTIKSGKFDWSPYTQGIILGSFFYGYAVTPLPGGRLAERYGAKWLFGTGIFITGLLSFLIPTAATYGGSGGLISVRILQGIGEGVSYPAAEAHLAHWIPIGERTTSFAFMHSGGLLGVVIGLSMSGVLIESDFLGGWPSVFYFFGLLTTIWFVFWGILTSSKPADHPWISQEEIDYINRDLGDQKPIHASKTPWKKIFTSMPVYAALLGLFGSNWLHYMLIIELPTYLGTVLNFEIKDNGFYSALPYVGAAVSSVVTAPIADYLRTRRIMKVTNIRKVYHAFAHIFPCIILGGVVWIAGCNGFLALVLFVIAGSMRACNEGSVMTIPVDMAPDYAGTVMGVMTSIANLPGFLVPWITGMLINEENSLRTWSYNFYIAVVVVLSCTVFFLFFASAEVQEWGLAPRNNGSDERKCKEPNI